MNNIALDSAGGRDPGEPDEMSREIADGPLAVSSTLACLRDERVGVLGQLTASSCLLFVGTGASLAMAQVALPLVQEHDAATGGGRETSVIEAAEILAGGHLTALERDCVVVAVSKSGSSPELLEVVKAAHAKGRLVVAVTAGADSALAAAADVSLFTPIGNEDGAATKSELAALAALLALAGVISFDPSTERRIHALLLQALENEQTPQRVGLAIAKARRIWLVGFGAAYGVATAFGLLLHEKAQLTALAATPSAFRHGLVEASAPLDALVVVDLATGSPYAQSYLAQLDRELAELGVTVGWIADGPVRGLHVRLHGGSPAERALEAVLRAQQITHAAAHHAGTYGDGFRTLRTFVRPGEPFM